MPFKLTRLHVLTFAVLSVVLFYFFTTKVSLFSRNVVYLTNDGFVPFGIKITKGEPVRFINKTDKPFWPASDPHPQHTNIAGFDSSKAVLPKMFYEYTFSETGSFRYHNHLNPSQRGVVKVLETATISDVDCKNTRDLYEQKECYSGELAEIQTLKGELSALTLLDKVVEENPGLQRECHDMAHYIGEESYWSYSKSKKIIKSDKISICGFGYVHGFMQEFAHHSVDFYSKSKDLCDYFAKDITYNGTKWDIEPGDTCYNGVGHGVVFLNYDDYSDNLALLAKVSANKCADISNDPKSLDHCYQGVFSGISGLYLGTHGYLIPLDEEPLKLCTSFERDFRERCLGNMIPVVGVLYNRDLEKLARTVKGFDLKDSEYVYKMIGNIASSWYEAGYANLQSIESFCAKSDYSLRKYCAKGFTEGLAYYSEFANAWKTVKLFCSNLGLSDYDTNECKMSFFLEFENLNSEMIENNLKSLDKKDFQFVCGNNIISKYCSYSNN